VVGVDCSSETTNLHYWTDLVVALGKGG